MRQGLISSSFPWAGSDGITLTAYSPLSWRMLWGCLSVRGTNTEERTPRNEHRGTNTEERTPRNEHRGTNTEERKNQAFVVNKLTFNFQDSINF